MHRARFIVTALAAGVLTAVSSAYAQTAKPGPAPAQKVRVGVFDSRMVALVYYNSDEHRKFIRQLMSDMEAAKKAENTARVAELEFQGPALQSLMHYQVFSNASIPNITAKLQDDLARIAREQRVGVIVSKWDVAYRDPDVEYVDVTDALVERFHPDEKILKWMADGKTRQPIPLLEAVMTLRPER